MKLISCIMNMQLKLDALMQSVEELKRCKSTSNNNDIDYDTTDVATVLPLAQMISLRNLERRLLDEQYKKKLIYHLARNGGNTLKEITCNILKYLIHDNVAVYYSWVGGKGKNALSSSPLAEVIFGAVRQNKPTKDSTNVEIITVIKNWLRHAPQRAKSKKTTIEAETEEIFFN